MVSSTTDSGGVSGKLSDARDKVIEEDEGDSRLSRLRIIILRLARDRRLTTGSSKGNSLDLVDENRCCLSGMDTVRTRLNDEEDDVSEDDVVVVLLLSVDVI